MWVRRSFGPIVSLLVATTAGCAVATEPSSSSADAVVAHETIAERLRAPMDVVRLSFPGRAYGTLSEERPSDPDRVGVLSTVLNDCTIVIERRRGRAGLYDDRITETTRVQFYLGSSMISHSLHLANELPVKAPDGRALDPWQDGFRYATPRENGAMASWVTAGLIYSYEGRDDRGFGFAERIAREALTLDATRSRPLSLVVRLAKQNALQSTWGGETAITEYSCIADPPDGE